MQHPVAIYADFESINQPVDDDPHSSGNQPVDDDPHSSGTTLKSKHICSGYSYTVVSPHCANRVKTYRGEDAGKQRSKQAVSFKQCRFLGARLTRNHCKGGIASTPKSIQGSFIAFLQHGQTQTQTRFGVKPSSACISTR